jgi:hypothetical protein
MRRLRRFRRCGGWLALLGLMLQIGLSTAHSARHFDHLIGPLGTADAAHAAAAQPRGDPSSPAPGSPPSPDPDQCAVDLCLAATGHIVLAEPARIPLRPEFEIAPLNTAAPSVASAVRRHSLPPARAPPVIEISA